MTTAPKRLTRAESRQRTRELLIAAAMRVFARDGYAGASVDAIAEEAGFTVGALYSNFATKQDLFMAVLERHCSGEVAAARALAASASSPDEVLRTVARQFGDDSAREWWQLMAELLVYAQRHPEAARRLAAVQAETRDVIAEALGPGGRRLSDETTALIHVLWTGFMMYRLVSPEVIEAGAFERAARRLLDGEQGGDQQA